MHKVVSKRSSPISSMEVSPKKCKKRGRRTSGNRMKRKLDHKIDYISDLPDHILHQILSRLHPKDAVRTCILSKKWKQVWNSYHVLDFDLHNFLNMKSASKEHCKKLINRLRNNGDEQFYSIDKFRLSFTKDSGVEICSIKCLILAAIERNVRELEVQLKDVRFCLSPRVMCASSIIALNLCGCVLPTCPVNLPRLQKLSLKKMKITPSMLQILIIGCPLIEDLRLIQCVELKTVVICSLDRLRRVDLHRCRVLSDIFIEAQGLEIFWFYSDKNRLCRINLPACRALKELILEYPRMTDDMFHDQVMGFQKLEKLVLSRCNALKNIRLVGDKLRKLVIRRCLKLKKAHIDTPNLTSLEYNGQRMPFLFHTRPSLKEVLLACEPSSEEATKWELRGDDASSLYRFLDYIDDDKGLNSMSLNKLDVVIYEDIRAMFLPLRHISNPNTVQISARFQDLIDAAFKMASLPSTLSIMSHRSSDFPEIICKELNREKKSPECCGCFVNKCWRHYLKNVSVENWIFESTEWSKASASLEWRKTTLTLVWDMKI